MRTPPADTTKTNQMTGGGGDRIIQVTHYVDDPLSGTMPISKKGFMVNDAGIRAVGANETIQAADSYAGAIRDPSTGRVTYYRTDRQFQDALLRYKQSAKEKAQSLSARYPKPKPSVYSFDYYRKGGEFDKAQEQKANDEAAKKLAWLK